jgi:hypothetical protein
MTDSRREFLRHALATVAYRGGKAVRGAPESFASFRAGEGTRTPIAILAHVGDLLDWALSLAEGKQVWKESPAGDWSEETGRFFRGLERLDARLAAEAPLGCSEERLFQGPIADALTHIGQIALLRRMAGTPVRAENYFKAEITAGRVGPDQAPPRREFD